ncbi:MAG TPA: hypothetical protein VKV95_02425 [Terriglobia bacterium]|nr:hypothetical protein [Terriglobia bacterium]
MHYAEPILRARVIETLSARFQSRVTLAAFHVSVGRELEVSGNGLNIFGKTDLNIHEPGIQPLLSIQEFRFHAGFFNFLHTPMRVHMVYLKGLQLNIPPKEQVQDSKTMRTEMGKAKIYVDQFVCEQAQLVINTLQPDKLPLQFDIGSLIMKDLGPDKPFRFDANLLNPKPVGDIHSTGLFGPWRADAPRDMPVQGTYSFTNADLSSINGIGGILSSTGNYQGALGRIIVDGETDTPDFRVSVSGHPVPLHTDFHAIVDGTSGDTYLQPIRAKILNSSLIATGYAERVKAPDGHRVYLELKIEDSKIEDLLRMAIRTEPPVMTGHMRLSTIFDLRPGTAAVPDRLRLAGNFEISKAHFTNDKIQAKVNELSMRGQGKPKQAKMDLPEDIPSIMKGKFRLDAGTFWFSQLQFFVPGTEVDLTGNYSLDGELFDFHGRARMDAKLSQMVGGWKSIFLKPVDPFFSKDGAGTEVPVKVIGTKSAPQFGLDFRHKK